MAGIKSIIKDFKSYSKVETEPISLQLTIREHKSATININGLNVMFTTGWDKVIGKHLFGKIWDKPDTNERYHTMGSVNLSPELLEKVKQTWESQGGEIEYFNSNHGHYTWIRISVNQDNFSSILDNLKID